MAAGMATAPFPMAPGLDAAPPGMGLASSLEPPLACDVTVVQGAIGSSSSRSGSSPDKKQSVLNDLRKSVLEDVDTKLSDKMKDLWSRGNKMLKQIDQENQQHTAKFMEELAQRREKQETLKVEQEQLRILLAGMVQQLSVLGSIYSGPVPAPGCSELTPGLGSSAADSSSATSDAGSLSAEQSPPPGLGGAPFPPMPDFPFPLAAAVTPVPSCATPLSLVEALCPEGIASPVPVSLMGSLAQGVLSLEAMIFSFTLRKAEGTDLGINVSHHELDKVLRVEGIRPEGAVEAWNRQCISNGAPEKAVMPGDRIVSVNGVINQPVKMLEECRDKLLLKFTVERGGIETRPSPTAAATPKATTMRADADVFVPMRADADVFVPAGLSTEQPLAEQGTED